MTLSEITKGIYRTVGEFGEKKKTTWGILKHDLRTPIPLVK